MNYVNHSSAGRSPGTYVVIGETHLASSVCASLRSTDNEVLHLARPGDEDLRAAIDREPEGVAVLSHDDVAALRYALAVAHISPTVPLIATIFDRTVADELTRLLPQCDVTSPADLVAPALVGPCLDPSVIAVQRHGDQVRAVRRRAGEPRVEDWHPHRQAGWRARLSRITSQMRPHDSGTRLLVLGMIAVFTMLLGDWAWLVGHGRQPAEALFDAARVVAGVGPATAAPGDHGYEVLASAAMLCTIAFTAVFTAGIVERMLGPKFIGLIGLRTLPRSGHVIVVGMGQVGMRLCMELRALGIPVVGVERDQNAATARLARSLGIPVMIGNGGDRSVLERLRLGHARALAAVGSDDLDNIAVSIAAHAIAPDTRVVIRAGEHEAIAETLSLLPMGTVRDVTTMAAAYVLAGFLRAPASAVISDHHDIYVQLADGTFVRTSLTGREHCGHAAKSTAQKDDWEARPRVARLGTG
ncbi:potassium channel family protein [Streptomyces sp. NBC_01190]|uniref:potassium channel family protein n=1 Tax=Streptomyces sp. NBC_01190 TaxID=2903767 RepID=UPI003866EF48|nr:NAD-binding protein [Streptomyces sp. NBC_01190]